MKTILYVFDFDGTLMQSPEPEQGRQLYERLFGKPYPHKGWWSKPESLHPEFDIRPNDDVLDHYRKASSDEAALSIMLTNRLTRLTSEIDFHLDKFALKFDAKFYGDTTDKKQTKPQRLSTYVESLRSEGNEIQHIIVLDDMDEQIQHYLSMREDLRLWCSPIKLTILHVQDGKITER